MQEQRAVNVAIIGCGLIGARWDAPPPSRASSLSHAAAFSRHERASLVAVCDPDSAKAEHAAQRWGGRPYFDATRMFAENRVELAVVATSSTVRWQVIEPALAAGVKVLVIEKPLAATFAESRMLAAAIDAAHVKSVVNFSRRWDPRMHELRVAIGSGELGALQRLIGLYGKGITNNGSHMIDLVGFLCEARPLRARALGSPLDPREAAWSGGADPALDAQVVYENPAGSQFHLTMLGTDQNSFTCFELRVIGQAALCDISRGGRDLRLTSIEGDPDYAGYRIPGMARALPAGALTAMEHMADEALQLALGTLQHPRCDVHSALRTAMTVEAIKRSAGAAGAWVDISSIVD
ncbi:MAG: Gfo/Idh/MocA family oxidoreductase [Pseudomonadota bacterium]|nr:Gfo/Idh/MocA family oxidoreductase [Pseudomonadota bacterium]